MVCQYIALLSHSNRVFSHKVRACWLQVQQLSGMIWFLGIVMSPGLFELVSLNRHSEGNCTPSRRSFSFQIEHGDGQT